MVSALPLVFLLVLLVVGLLLQAQSQSGNAFEQHTQVVLGRADRIHALLGVASRYATSPQTRYGEKKLGGVRAQIDAELHALQSEVQGDTGVPKRLNALTVSVRDAVTLIEQYAALMRSGNAAQAKKLGDAPSTRALANRLTAASDGFVSQERRDELLKLVQLREAAHRYQIALIVACVVGIVLTLFVSGRFGLELAGRLGHLAENARRLARGEDAEPLLGNDEFTDLDVVYQAMMRQIAREQQLNSRLQRMLLPHQLPSFEGIRIDTAYVPAAQEREVGGDWYDVFTVSGRRICISIGDVAGHGLRAASVMAGARLAVRTAARMQDDPGAIVAHLNRVICADEPDTIVTAFVAILDIDDGTLRYTAAGHPEPLLIRTGGEMQFLAGKGLVLGADPNASYETFQTQMHEGWALLLYTDGLIEIERDYFQGLNDICEAAAKEYASPAQNIAEAIQQRVFRGRRAGDDAAVLFVGVTHLGAAHADRPQRNWVLDARDADSARSAKRAILWHLGDTIRDETQLASIELALGELIGNVARHSPGIAEVTIEQRDSRVHLRVIDRGEPFAYHHSNGSARDLLAESGRGLFLVHTVAEDLRVEHNGTGNVITAVFRRIAR